MIIKEDVVDFVLVGIFLPQLWRFLHGNVYLLEKVRRISLGSAVNEDSEFGIEFPDEITADVEIIKYRSGEFVIFNEVNSIFGAG